MFFDSDNNGAPGPVEPVIPRGPVVWLRNRFLTGMAVITPLIVTFWILQFVYTTLHDWNETLLNFISTELNIIAGHVVIDTASEGFKQFNTFVGVLIPVLVLVALGTLASNVIGRQVVEAVDKLVLRVPFINFVYKLMKQVIDSFKNFGSSKGFKRVVYIDYPAPGMWMLGFVTGQYYDQKRSKAMSLVFVPGALSPMTGLLLAVEMERLTDAPMTMEEAMKMVFSGGLVAPSSLQGPRPAEVPPVATPPTRPDLPPGLPVADADEVLPAVPVTALAGATVMTKGAEPAATTSTESSANAPTPPPGSKSWRRALAAIRGAHETV